MRTWNVKKTEWKKKLEIVGKEKKPGKDAQNEEGTNIKECCISVRTRRRECKKEKKR